MDPLFLVLRDDYELVLEAVDDEYGRHAVRVRLEHDTDHLFGRYALDEQSFHALLYRSRYVFSVNLNIYST